MSSKLKIDPVAWSEYIFYKKATLKRYHLYWGKLVRESASGLKRIDLYEKQEQPSTALAAVSVELTDALSVKTVEGRGGRSNAQRHEFQVLTTSGKHQFATKTEEECRMWMEKLDRILHGPPEAGVTYEFQLQILPTSHSDKLGLEGNHLMRIMDDTMILYSASGSLPTQFECKLAHITKARYTYVTGGGNNFPLLSIQTNRHAKIGEGGFAFSAKSAADMVTVIQYRRRPPPPTKPRKATATNPGAPIVSPSALQPQQRNATQDKNSSSTPNPSHHPPPSSIKPPTPPRPPILPRLPVGAAQLQRSTSPLPPSTSPKPSFDFKARLSMSLPGKNSSDLALPIPSSPSASNTPPKVLKKPLKCSLSQLASPRTPTKADQRHSWTSSSQCSDESDSDAPNSWIAAAEEKRYHPLPKLTKQEPTPPALSCRPTKPHPLTKEPSYIHILPSQNDSMPGIRSPKVVRELPEGRVMHRQSTIRRAISEESLNTKTDIHQVDRLNSLDLQDNPVYDINDRTISPYALLRMVTEDGSPYSILYTDDDVDSRPPARTPVVSGTEADEELNYDYIAHGRHRMSFSSVHKHPFSSALQPQQRNATQDKNSSSTANPSHLPPSSTKPPTPPKPPILPVSTAQLRRSTSPLPPSTSLKPNFAFKARLSKTLPGKTSFDPALPIPSSPSASNTPPKVLKKPLRCSLSQLASPRTPTKADQRHSWTSSSQCSDESNSDAPNSWIATAEEKRYHPLPKLTKQEPTPPALSCRPTKPHPLTKEPSYIRILPSQNDSMPGIRSPKVVRELPEGRVMHRQSTIRRAISEESLNTKTDIHQVDRLDSIDLQDNPAYDINDRTVSPYALLRMVTEDGSPYSVLYTDDDVDSRPPARTPVVSGTEADEELSYDYIAHGAFYTRRERTQATYVDTNRNRHRPSIPPATEEGAGQREKGRSSLERRPPPPHPPRPPDTDLYANVTGAN